MTQTRTSGAVGIRKAAVLLVSVDQDAAGMIMSRLDHDTLEAVTEHIAKLGTVTREERDRVIEEFYQMNLAKDYVQQGGIDYARRLLARSLAGGEAEAIVEHVEKALQSTPFAFARKAESQNLLTFIHDEHPQTIALVLSHLEAAQAAEVLQGLPREIQVDVVRRMATMENTSPEVVREVEAGLEKRMSAVLSQRLEKTGGVAAAAQVLNLTDRATERAILEALEADSPELVEDIRHRMFVFEDIMLVDDRGVQQLLKSIETQDLALALRTAGDELKEKIFRNMSDRAATVLKEEMEYMGPARLKDVEAAQQRVADVVRRLEEAGELIIYGRGGEEAVVV